MIALPSESWKNASLDAEPSVRHKHPVDSDVHEGPSDESLARPHTLIIGVWLLASLLLLGVSLAVGKPFPSVSASWGLGLSIGLVAVMAVWLSLGAVPAFLRFLVCCVGILVLSASGASVTGVEVGEWSGFFGILAAAIAGVLCLFRCVGFRLVTAHAGGSDQPCSRQSGPTARQFTIGGLLLLTTCAAILAASLQWLRLPEGHILVLVGFLFGWSAATLLTWLAIMLPLKALVRSLFVVSVFLLVGLVSILEGPEPAIVISTLIAVAYTGFTASLLRLSGVRFVWIP